MVNVLIAGCNGGLGKLLYERLESNGVWNGQNIERVFAIDYFRNEEALQEQQQKVNASRPKHAFPVEFFHWNAADIQSTVKLVRQLDERMKRVELAIITTGIGFHGKLAGMPLEASEEVLTRLLRINAVGPALLSQYLSSRMQKQSNEGFAGGFSYPPTVLIISSYSGVVGLPFRAAYCSSKFALNGYVEGLNAEFSGVRYVLICPTSVSTDFRDNWKKNLGGSAGRAPPDVQVNKADLTPEQCVQGIWDALNDPKKAKRAELHYVILPHGKPEIAFWGGRLPKIDTYLRKRIHKASAKL